MIAYRFLPLAALPEVDPAAFADSCGEDRHCNRGGGVYELSALEQPTRDHRSSCNETRTCCKSIAGDWRLQPCDRRRAIDPACPKPSQRNPHPGNPHHKPSHFRLHKQLQLTECALHEPMSGFRCPFTEPARYQRGPTRTTARDFRPSIRYSEQPANPMPAKLHDATTKLLCHLSLDSRTASRACGRQRASLLRWLCTMGSSRKNSPRIDGRRAYSAPVFLIPQRKGRPEAAAAQHQNISCA
jgi:hypothetical protein